MPLCYFRCLPVVISLFYRNNEDLLLIIGSHLLLLHRASTSSVSSITCSRGVRATYSSTECSLTTPVERVKTFICTRKPLVSLPMKVGFICKAAPRLARASP